MDAKKSYSDFSSFAGSLGCYNLKFRGANRRTFFVLEEHETKTSFYKGRSWFCNKKLNDEGAWYYVVDLIDFEVEKIWPKKDEWLDFNANEIETWEDQRAN